jgi:hypothetical protein
MKASEYLISERKNCSMEGTQYHIVEQTPDKVEVSFARIYNASIDTVPLNIDKR